MRFSIRSLLGWSLAFTAVSPRLAEAARPVLQVSVDPPRAANGELIKFKILVRYETNAPMRAPRMPELNEWRIINSFDSNSVNSVLLQGRISTRFQYEYTWLLKPLRTGKLLIPGLDLWVGSAHYKTDEVEVIVDRLADGSQRPQMPPSQRPSHPAPHAQPQDDEDPWGGQVPQLPSTQGPTASQRDFVPPARQGFFVRAEASNSKVYQGELITLSYVLYERRPSIANPEISKFPDFKGFLKEELSIPKTLTRTPVTVQGETLYRSELIKYAIFPLKSGQLKVEALSFKADYIASPIDDMIGNLMNGVVPPNFGQNFGQPIPMRKSTQAVPVESKPLPSPPPGAVFTGGVGTFKMEVQAPTGRLQVDQPFTVTLTIKGSGNVKVIEEPPLSLPKNIEPYQTKNNYEFHEDATGYKSFEYLLLPRAPGKVQLPGITWTYFDPQKAQYVTLNSEPMEFNIEGSTGGGNSSAGATQAPTPTKALQWSVPGSGRQNFIPLSEMQDTWVARPAWALQAGLYALLAFIFLRRKKEESETDLFRRAPWEKTSRLILSKSARPKMELAILVDQWTRERLAGFVKRPDIHSESSRDEFLEALKTKVHPENYRHLDVLKKFWSELDLLRFTGETSKDNADSKNLLDQATRAINPLLKS